MRISYKEICVVMYRSANQLFVKLKSNLFCQISGSLKLKYIWLFS